MTVEKYVDADGDIETTADWTLISWTITLTNSTDDFVGYIFPGQEPGSVTVTEADDPGWVHLNATNYMELTMESGGSYLVKFVNFEKATVIVYKYVDADGDIETTDDWTLIEWDYITLNNGSDHTAVFDSVNGYVFPGQENVFVTVTEQDVSGWTLLNETNTWSKQMESGKTYIVKFVNFQWMKIWGYKYLDYNGEQPDDIRLGGWTIELYRYGESSSLYDSVVTGTGNSWPLGYYEFIVKDPGTYYIMEVLKNGWDQTYPCYVESPEDGSTPSVLGYPDFTVTSGVDIPDMDFWNRLVMTWITDTSDQRNPVTDFKIVFTPDVQPGGLFFKISATNPGQFYMNILYHAGTTSQTVSYTMPDGWAVKGLGNPIHAYIWDDNGDGVIDYLTELVDITQKITVVDGIILVEDITICNDILITIHLQFTEKGRDGFYWEGEPLDNDDVQDYKDRPYIFAASVDTYASETTLTSHIKGKLPREPAVYGTVMDATMEDLPVTGVTFSIINSKGRSVQSFTTDEYGYYLFDNLKPDTYTLEIDIPLSILVEGLEETTLVLHVTIELIINKGDFIQVSVYIDVEGATVQGPPGQVPTERIVDSSISSSYTNNPGDNARSFWDPFARDSGVDFAIMDGTIALGLPILVGWFASVLSLAYTFDARQRRKLAKAKSEASHRRSKLEWSLPDSDPEWIDR